MRRKLSKWSMDHLRPLSLYSTRGWGPSAIIMYKRLASLITMKHAASYSEMMRMIRCKIAFSLIDSAVMCLKGARLSFHKPVKALDWIDTPVDLVVNEGRVASELITYFTDHYLILSPPTSFCYVVCMVHF